MMHLSLIILFEKHSVISNLQCDLRKERSTEMAVPAQKKLIIQSFEKNLMALGILIHYSKAFDHVNHNHLLKKLSAYGVRGWASTLITSYLLHRNDA